MGTLHCCGDGVNAKAGEIVRSVVLVERDLVVGRRQCLFKVGECIYTSQNTC